MWFYYTFVCKTFLDSIGNIYLFCNLGDSNVLDWKMLALQLLYLALFIYFTYTNEYARMGEKFMAVTLVNQEWCPQFTGISLCNSSRDVTMVDVNKTRLRRSARNPNTDGKLFRFFSTSCSKLTMSFVNDSLKLQMAILQIHCYFC